MAKIKDIPKANRPREKLKKKGSQNLKEAELLAILLRTGYAGKNVLALAKHLLRERSMSELFNLSYKDLSKLKGIGEAKAITLQAAFELSKRALKAGEDDKVIIDKAKDAFAQVANLVNKKQEYLVVLYLNGRNQLIDKEVITIGTLKANLISPREIFSSALDKTAAFVILAHNHPSGDETPSSEDMAITKKIVKAGKIMDVEVFDHLIVSQNGYFSFRQKKPEIFK